MPLIRLLLDICLFHKGPQDVPAAPMLLKLALSVYFVMGMTLTVMETPWLEAVLLVPLEMAMLLAFVWVSLKAAAKTNRWLQTSIAMLGTDALLSSIAVPLKAVLLANPGIGILHLLLLLLMLWQIGVVAHILRHALSQTLAIGLALSIVYVLFSLQLLVFLFGSPEAAAG